MMLNFLFVIQQFLCHFLFMSVNKLPVLAADGCTTNYVAVTC